MAFLERDVMVKKFTDSVLSYIFSPDGRKTVEGYFSKLDGAKPSYTGLLSSMQIGSGTTKEDVRFDSIYVDRGVVTQNLREMYSFSE